MTFRIQATGGIPASFDAKASAEPEF